MPASNTDKFIKVAPNTGWQLDASGISDASVTSFGLISATSLPTDTAVILTIDRVNSSGVATPNLMERIVGVMSGTTVTSCVRGLEGTAQAHAAGAVVEIVISKSNINKLMEGILVEHNQDGTHNLSATAIATPIHAATSKTTPVDADELGLIDSAASWVLKKVTVLAIKLAVYAGIKPAEGTVWNGKISVTDTGSGINVALKTLSGADASSSDPIYITIAGAVRTITGALSVTKADGTNWCNAGSAELATKEIDYFVYLGYNATDGVVIGFSRIPSANSYDDFSATTTNEKYCAISTITNAAATDYYEVIGRFAATLSAGAGYTWSVPTFTANNLIQRPIYETRLLTWAPVWTGFSSAPTGNYNYRVLSNRVLLTHTPSVGGVSNATTFKFSLPFTSGNTNAASALVINVQDSSSNQSTPGHIEISSNSTTADCYKSFYRGTWTASSTKDVFWHELMYEI